MIKRSLFNLNNILLFSIIIVGILLRVYKFPGYPHFTDEVRESLIAYDLYRLNNIPLTSFSKYIGPYQVYILSISMWIIGPNIWLPRIISFVINIITIYLAYIFGKEWANKRIGILTSLYVALSPTLILVNSRVAWATCLSPFFGLLQLIFVNRFRKNISYKYLIYIGLTTGLLLNLHPLLLFYTIPIVLYVIYLILRNVKQSKITYLTVFLGSVILVMLPLIIANTLDPFTSFKGAIEQDNISVDKLTPNKSDYLIDLDRSSAQMEHMINHSVIFDSITIPEYVYTPIYIINNFYDTLFFIFLFGSLLLVYKYKLRDIALLTSIFLMIILSPLINSSYFEGLKIRYYSILIPLIAYVISYAFYKIYYFKNNFYIKSVTSIVIIITLIYIPYSNLSKLFIIKNDTDNKIYKDVEFLVSKSNEGVDVYYIDDASRDNNKDFAIVEYLIKFAPTSKHNAILDNNFEPSDNNILVVPKSLDNNNDNTDEIYDIIGEMDKIYFGLAIVAYQ